MTRQPTRRGLLGINLDEAQGEISLSLTTQPGPLRTREPTRTYLVGSGRRAWVLELELRRPVPPAMYSTPIAVVGGTDAIATDRSHSFGRSS